MEENCDKVLSICPNQILRPLLFVKLLELDDCTVSIIIAYSRNDFT